MAQVNKIDSNSSGLRYTKEASIGVLPGGTPVWTQLEPNQYNDFGGQYKSLARNPINSGRQRKKGVTVDLDSSGGFNSDLTQTNIQDLLQGFFFASLRPKIEFGNGSGVITGVTSTYNAASGLTFAVNDLIFASGFGVAANNGFKLVTSASGTAVGAASLATEASPPAAAKLVRVGVRSASGDVDVDVSGTWPKITSTTLDFTTLGLIVGEWIFLGGDAGANQFTNAVNNGFKRIKSIAAHAIEFDKSSTTMTAESNTTKLVDIYFGRVIKNEDGSDSLHPIVRSSYQLERSLGAPDDSSANLQYEYLPGSVANELTLNLQRADKINMDLAFVSTSHELLSAGSPKTGTRPVLQDADAFNTSSDFTRSKMSIITTGSSNPSALFAYLTEAKITIKNNVTPAKALGVLGAFDVTAGTFEVSGTLTAYFSNVSAINAVKNNSDVTLDFIIVKNNAGVAIDMPLIALGDGRAKVEQDQPITLPLNMDAATAAKIDTATNYTLLMVFFDYLPSAADS